MGEQIERADIGRVYRAIGNSSGMPMPDTVTIVGGDLHLSFADGNEASVDMWIAATGGEPARSEVRRPPESDRAWHVYGNGHSFGSLGVWLGWSVRVSCFVYAEHPEATEPKLSPVLGTGDEPAEEAIVPGDRVSITAERAARLRAIDAHLADLDPSAQLDVGEIRRLIAEGPDADGREIPSTPEDTTGWDATTPLIASGEAGVLVLRVTGSAGAVFSHTPTDAPDPLGGEAACPLLGGRPCRVDAIGRERRQAIHEAWQADPALGMDALTELYRDIFGVAPLVTSITDPRYVPGGEA